MNDNIQSSPHKGSSRSKKAEKETEQKIINNNSINLEFKSTNSSVSGKLHKKKKSSKNGYNSIQHNSAPKIKQGVNFKKNFVEIINVECWKKYNMDISVSQSESGDKDKTKCTCSIF